MAAPLMQFLESNWISMNFPKRDELSLRTVLALPNVSRIGLDWSTCCSTVRFSSPPLAPAPGEAACPPRKARKFMMSLLVSVLPAPLSPLISTDWEWPSLHIFRYALSAMAYTCGESSPSGRSVYSVIMWSP